MTHSNASMKIITVNIPLAFHRHILKMLDKKNEDNYLGYHPSVSEFVRVAIRDKLVKDMELYGHLRDIDIPEPEKKVKVPRTDDDFLKENNITIIRRLEY